MLDELFHGGTDSALLALIGVLVWVFKRQLKIYDKHLETCDQIPKSLIMTSLDTLSSRVDETHTALTNLVTGQTELTRQVAILVGRQAERDAQH